MEWNADAATQHLARPRTINARTALEIAYYAKTAWFKPMTSSIRFTEYRCGMDCTSNVER